MIIQSRRNFITGLTSLLAAPAIVRVQNIMPVKVIDKLPNYLIDRIIGIDVAYGYLFVKEEWVDGMLKFTKVKPEELFIK